MTHFKKQYIHEGIYCIEDFLNEEELNILYSEAIEEDWPEDDSDIDSAIKSNWSGKIKKIKDQSLMKNIVLRVKEQMPQDKKYVQFTNSKSIKRYRVGDLDRGGKYAMNPHHDGIKHPWEFGGIIYLNDNFTGGEITYENIGKTVKPKPGMLVMHEANEDCVHRVEAVTEGTRYMITFFGGDPENEKLRSQLDYYLIEKGQMDGK
jgi:hypothetical protein